jgi:hypothetical protein
MQFNFPEIQIIPFPKDDFSVCQADYHIPLLSIPGAIGTTMDTIPSAIYLRPEPAYLDKWRRLLKDEVSQNFNAGLCWAGGQRPDDPDAMRTDARRSLHFEQMKPLLDTYNVSFFSLQIGPPKQELNDARVKDMSVEIKSWSDTAALVSFLDLVISADTSVCHLAAGMGKRTFLLNRYDTCWRWLLHRDDSPWYPSLTQFRQKEPGDWGSVIGRIKTALVKRVENT